MNPSVSAGNLGFILGLEDPLEEEMATHSSILPWKSHGQRSFPGYNPKGHKELNTTEPLSKSTALEMIYPMTHSISECFNIQLSSPENAEGRMLISLGHGR